MNKKIRSIKKVFFFSFVLCTSFFAGAQDWKDFHFDVSPYYSFNWGTQDEYVYVDAAGKDETLSELNWDLKPINILGIEAKAGWKNFYAGGGVEFGIPADCGIVKDSDWKNINKTQLSETQRNYKTNYSESDLALDMDYSIDVFLLYKFNFLKKFSLSPIIKYQYDYSKFTATDTWYCYGFDDGNNNYLEWTTGKNKDKTRVLNSYAGEWTTKDSDVLALEREKYTLFLGFNFEYSPIESLHISMDNFINLYMKINSLDYHYYPEITGGKNFLDLMDDFINGYQGKISTEYFFNENNSIYISFDYFVTKTFHGDTHTRDIGSTGSWAKASTTSGASFENIKFTAGYRFTLN